MKKKQRVVLIFLVAFLLMGCTDINGNPPKKSEVMKAVKEEVTSEKYEFVSVEHLDEERPKQDVYTFRSKERELEFTAIGTLSPFGIDGSTLGYNPCVQVHYEEAVQSLYLDRIEAMLGERENWQEDKGRFYYSSYEELEDTAAFFAKIDKIYQEESAYNTLSWLKDHPVKTIRVAFAPEVSDTQEEKWKNSTQTMQVKLNGNVEEKTLYKDLVYYHSFAIRNGLFEDDTVPASVMEQAHISELNKIMFEDTDLAGKAYQEDREAYRNNTTEYHYHCIYSKELESYVLLLDIGMTDDTYAPQLFKTYCEAFGYPYQVKAGKNEISWQAGGHKWTAVANEDKKGHLQSVTFTCDGLEQIVTYLTNQEEQGIVMGTYLMGLPVDEFSRLFDVGYTIDEDMRTIILKKR